MKFRALQENLRSILRTRIRKGDLTGIELAAQAGLTQAHISNFLNRKRGLSLEGMDRVLTVQHLSVLDLLDPAEINKRASIRPPSGDDFEDVSVVAGSVAAHEAIVMDMNVRDALKFKKDFLRRLRPELVGNRSQWERFLVVRLEGREGMSMYPRLLPGAAVLVDRHYNSLKPYRRREANMYAVNKLGVCTVKYVETTGDHLILRPHNPAYPIEILPIEHGKGPSDYVIGRVSHSGMET
jgi:hypothetical protein